MKYVRQLLIKSKNKKDIAFLCNEMQKLARITYVQQLTIMECIDKDKYDYIDSRYDFSVLLYFASENGVEEYCNHPIHVNFARELLKRADVTVVDYSIKNNF